MPHSTRCAVGIESLHDLGVTNPDALLHASAIGQAGEQLILEKAQGRELPPEGFPAGGLSRSVGTAEVINHMLASGDPHAAAILRPRRHAPVAGRSGSPAGGGRP